MPFSLTDTDKLPDKPGVYLMKNSSRQVIYVGKAKNLRKRVKQYFTGKREERAQIPYLLKELVSLDTITVPTEKEALLLENTLIKQHSPKFNILLKDDKNYISLSLDPGEEWPRLRWTRVKSRLKKGVLYFGPYTSSRAARKTFDLMTSLFKLRQCSNEELKRRERPCLLYGIKKCIAPCVQMCTKEEYQREVEGAIAFLQGGSEDVCSDLEKKMARASDDLEFELAGSLLELIRQIKEVTNASSLSCNLSYPDTDVLHIHWESEKAVILKLLFRQGKLVGSEPFFFENALESDEELLSSFLLQNYAPGKFLPKELILPFTPRSALEEAFLEHLQTKISLCHPKRGLKCKLLSLAKENAKEAFTQKRKEQISSEAILSSLQETLFLTTYPRHIECFDTSNLAGKQPVASMVVFIDGKHERKLDRVYHINDLTIPDDYAALKQTLTRRLLRAQKEERLPDLLVIDGGKGQLGIALGVLQELGIISIDVISLVKEEARHDKGLTLERVFIPSKKEALSLPMRSKELFFLQKMRDEAHTKAINFHRKTRAKQTVFSTLQEVPGIGPVKQKCLLKHFGSVTNILSSKEESLVNLEGFSKADVEKVKNHFKKK